MYYISHAPKFQGREKKKNVCIILYFNIAACCSCGASEKEQVKRRSKQWQAIQPEKIKKVKS